jgi:ABC-2 type transport system permease protein
MSGRVQGLRACVRKELLLLSRDLHGLALLFLMPLAFVLIMSLALQDQFAGPRATKLKVLVLDADRSEASQGVLSLLGDGKAFELVAPATSLDDAATDELLRRGEYAFALRITAGFADALTDNDEERTSSLIQIGVAPDTGKQTETIFVTTVTAALGRERMRAILEGLGMAGAVKENNSTDIAVRYAYVGGERARRPSSVQQSVPAWLVFGAFFVVMPLSNTLIKERQQGTLRRLRSTNLGTFTLLFGKLLPYFAINQVQLLLMLAAGCYLVPLLGGDALQLNGSMVLLATMSVALSICSLGLALLIAVSAGTTEQAALLGGTGNILLAALGGIMVPKFVMPATLQNIAQWSPMSWGLEGFLDVLLRDGSARDMAPEALGLTLLGMAAILLAWRIQSRRAD